MNKNRIVLHSSNPTSGQLSEAMELIQQRDLHSHVYCRIVIVAKHRRAEYINEWLWRRHAVLIQNNTKSSKETNPAHVPQHGRTRILCLMEEDRATYCTISVVPGILKQTQKQWDRGLGCSSAGVVLAYYAWVPEFYPQHHINQVWSWGQHGLHESLSQK